LESRTVEDEAREYVEHVVRKSNQDPERIPAEALERAIRTATAELREAADLARKAEK